MREELGRLPELERTLVVDVTPANVGRDPERLAQVAAELGLDIVYGCGRYIAESRPGDVPDEPAESYRDEILAEFEDSARRPSVIGEIGTGDPIEPVERASLRGAAMAQAELGVPLYVHLHPWARRGHEALDIVESAGGDLERTVLCHLDPQIPGGLAYHAELCERGATIAFDIWGDELDYGAVAMPTDEERLSATLELIGLGHGDRLVHAHDVCTKTQLRRWGGAGFDHLPRTVAPRMRAAGLDDEEVHRQLAGNVDVAARGALTPMRLRELRGMVGVRRPQLAPAKRMLARCHDIADLEAAARRRMPRGVFDYVAGGADEELTVERNLAAFRRWQFVPQNLRDVGDVDTAVHLLGQRVAMPLLFSPTGYTRMMHPAGECAVARAARRAGIPYGAVHGRFDVDRGARRDGSPEPLVPALCVARSRSGRGACRPRLGARLPDARGERRRARIGPPDPRRSQRPDDSTPPDCPHADRHCPPPRVVGARAPGPRRAVRERAARRGVVRPNDRGHDGAVRPIRLVAGPGGAADALAGTARPEGCDRSRRRTARDRRGLRRPPSLEPRRPPARPHHPTDRPAGRGPRARSGTSRRSSSTPASATAPIWRSPSHSGQMQAPSGGRISTALWRPASPESTALRRSSRRSSAGRSSSSVWRRSESCARLGPPC